MNAERRAALRALLAGDGVEQLRAATPGSVVTNDDGDNWARLSELADDWIDELGDRTDSADLAVGGYALIVVGVDVAELRALLDAADERDRLRAAIESALADEERGCGAMAFHLTRAIAEPRDSTPAF